nr:M6 family metalloprotease domain-containing protein [Oceanipulchritudo coccoides]
MIAFLPVGLMALQPPDAEQWEQLQASGNLERRQASAMRYGNDRPEQDLVRRAIELRAEAVVAHGGGYAELSRQLPSTWDGVPPIGEANVLVFLMDFADHRAETKFPGLTRTRIDANIFGNGTVEAQPYTPRESMRNFYQRASNNLLQIKGQTYGWYNFPLTQESYKSMDSDDDIETNWSMAREVLLAYDALIDYSEYDNDGDGYVDALNFIWSGEIGEWSSFWWGYRWSFYNDAARDFILDGVRFSDFSWQWVETREEVPNDYDPRVIIHEFGHLLGLPDLYDYEPEVGPEGGAGGGCVMDSSRSGNFNAYFRWLLGWIEPEVHTVGDEAIVSVTPSGALNSENPALVVYFETPDGGVVDPFAPFSEMLLVENRQAVGNDGGIATVPTDGLFLWHIHGALNENNNGFLFNNSRTEHKMMRLIQRDGLEEVEQLGANIDEGDLFGPGDTFSPWSEPASATYAYAPSRLVLDSITRSPNGNMGMRLGAYTGPLVRVSPSHLQLRTGPGLDHPPTAFTFYSESYEGSLSLGAAQLLANASSPGSIDIPLDGETAQYIAWDTADKPLHMTRERIVFTPSSGSAPPVSIPVQLQVRIPLEDALSFWDGYWDTGRHRPWYGQEAVTWTPPFAAASGKVDDDRQAYLSGWVRGPGTVSFYIKTSTEPELDEVRFQVDGVTRLRLSGEQDWRRYSYYTGESGWVQVRWVYSKSEEGSAGQDQVWVDDFQFNPDYMTWFESVAGDNGFAPDHTAKPFNDDRTLLEHFAFAPDPGNTTQLFADVMWPQFEVIADEAYPVVRMSFASPHYGARYTPQASADGNRWFTLIHGEEGVEFNNVEWSTSDIGTVDIPAHAYQFYRLLLIER